MRQYFATIDQDGREVALRVPNAADRACLSRRRVEHVEACDTCSSDGACDDDGMVEDWLRLPMWLTRDPDCAGSDTCDAGCDELSLIEAVDAVAATERDRVVAAHLEAMRDLSDHLDAACAVADSGDLGRALCVACMTEPATHMELLGDVLAELGSDLAQVVAAYQVRVSVEPRHDGATSP